MFRAHFVVPAVLIAVSSLVCSCHAQDTSTTSCYLDDGRQVYIRYNATTTKNERISNGKPFMPGGTAMTLFTEAPLTFYGATIPLGAYSVYPIPEKGKWTLAINKNVTPGAPYDEKQDIAHASVETDQLPDQESLEVAFAHVGSKCTLRIVFGKTAAFADFTVK
ncbi:MAG TPA: DUF2911 domain-containing protein [Candidatus Sulfotelmatobacter sp.]|jgi:hypothetical protein